MAENPFWDFSLRHYVNPSVQALCLQLQDEIQANVNLLLFALWLAEQRRVFDVSLINAHSPFLSWREQVVLPLRQSRVAAKQLQGRNAAYEALKKCELQVERVEQDLLFDLGQTLPIAGPAYSGEQLVNENLMGYLATLPLTVAQREQIASQLVDAVFPSN